MHLYSQSPLSSGSKGRQLGEIPNSTGKMSQTVWGPAERCSARRAIVRRLGACAANVGGTASPPPAHRDAERGSVRRSGCIRGHRGPPGGGGRGSPAVLSHDLRRSRDKKPAYPLCSRRSSHGCQVRGSFSPGRKVNHGGHGERWGQREWCGFHTAPQRWLRDPTTEPSMDRPTTERDCPPAPPCPPWSKTLSGAVPSMGSRWPRCHGPAGNPRQPDERS